MEVAGSLEKLVKFRADYTATDPRKRKSMLTAVRTEILAKVELFPCLFIAPSN
jgi:hypothetical protein